MEDVFQVALKILCKWEIFVSIVIPPALVAHKILSHAINAEMDIINFKKGATNSAQMDFILIIP